MIPPPHFYALGVIVSCILRWFRMDKRPEGKGRGNLPPWEGVTSPLPFSALTDLSLGTSSVSFGVGKNDTHPYWGVPLPLLGMRAFNIAFIP